MWREGGDLALFTSLVVATEEAMGKPSSCRTHGSLMTSVCLPAPYLTNGINDTERFPNYSVSPS